MDIRQIQKSASNADTWKVAVLGGEKDPNVRYDVTDPKVIQKLSDLIVSNNELEEADGGLALDPMVFIELVHDKTEKSEKTITKVEIGEKAFFVKLDNQYYLTYLKSKELYQRLVDKNFVFPKEPVQQRESDVQPEQPPTKDKESTEVHLESWLDRNDLLFNRRALPERNAPILDDLLSASSHRYPPPASPTRVRRLNPPQKSDVPGNADRDIPGAVPTLPDMQHVLNRLVRRTGPPIAPPLVPPQ